MGNVLSVSLKLSISVERISGINFLKKMKTLSPLKEVYAYRQKLAVIASDFNVYCACKTTTTQRYSYFSFYEHKPNER